MSKPDEEVEGEDPFEVVGAHGCDPAAPSCEFRPEEREGPPHESEHLVMDEVVESYVPQTIRMITSPEDGLPIPADESPQLALAPAFSIDTMLCVEDARTYVEVFEEDLRDEEIFALAQLTEEPPQKRRLRKIVLAAAVVLAAACLAVAVVAKTLIGAVFAVAVLVFGWSRATGGAPGVQDATQSRYDDIGREKAASTYAPNVVKRRFGVSYVRKGESIVVVRPKREACKHYRRQLFANDEVLDPEAPGGKVLFRNCMMRRSIGGAFMSLRDEAVFACEYRDPRSPEHDKKLDDLDAKILKKSGERTMVPLFNITKKPDKAALASAVASATDADVASAPAEASKKEEDPS